MIDFTKRKFLTLSHQGQHQKCAELLRYIYDSDHSTSKAAEEHYQQLLEWMNEPHYDLLTYKRIADRYHWHLQQAQIFKREHHLLPNIRKGDRAKGEPAWPISIYLDQLRSAHNIGSIIRTVEAFSLGNLYFSPQTPFITNKQVQDTSMGTLSWIHCFQGIELSFLPRPFIVLETSPQALSLHEFIFPSSFTLVLGNEEYGCSDETLKVADFLVEIPLRGHKNSLNVANAFACVAGEISRQKKLESIKKDF